LKKPSFPGGFFAFAIARSTVDGFVAAPKNPKGRRPRPEPPPLPGAGRGWGALARKGARDITDEGARRERRGAAAARDDEPFVREEFVELDRSRDAETKQRSKPRPRRTLPPDVIAELQREGGRRAPTFIRHLAEATHAFEADRFSDSRRLAAPVAKAVPGAASARALLGLTYYRLGRWKEAARELEAARSISGDVTNHPILADSYRALGRHEKVEQLWEELREASPDAAAVAEGRIVMAGSHADRGDVRGAIRILEQAKARPTAPADHHLRIWYALGDLYERAGELPKARELFDRVARQDPNFVDVADRRRSLS
jgi:tetratricopeptide (TPR) repeat protein